MYTGRAVFDANNRRDRTAFEKVELGAFFGLLEASGMGLF